MVFKKKHILCNGNCESEIKCDKHFQNADDFSGQINY